MGFIIKNTSGLINTRITDVGRRKLSQGNFNISYFQVGDSEVNYDKLGLTYNYNNNYVLEPNFNSQNNTGTPQSNKDEVKYPYFVIGSSGNTYGIPYMESKAESVYNSTPIRGFFSGNTGTSVSFSAKTTSAFTINSNYYITLSSCTGSNQVTLLSGSCSPSTGTPQVNDFITIYFDGLANCGQVYDSYPILTYKIQAVSGLTIDLDRNLPDYSALSYSGNAGCLIYPSGMTVIYDFETPEPYYPNDVFNFETPCDISKDDVKVWNMNIPWTENPAGLNTSIYEGYDKFGSANYIGTKEYFGYNNSSGQTDSGSVFYTNSVGTQITVRPEEQKAISIIHYTNNAIDNFYGEKFATEPYDAATSETTNGQARNFRLDIPWLMWHKNPDGEIGETFYIDPPNFDGFQEYYLTSNKNPDMNNPGMRYYNLWDDYGNRVGKVFPDSKLVIIDDEEIIAAMSYKSNRNWTLPAPGLSLMTPNVCEGSQQVNPDGVLSADTEYMYVTYRFDTTGFTNSLHCNYYGKIQGPKLDCADITQNVALRFGSEFKFLSQGELSGYTATSFKVLCQKVLTNDARPNPTLWREIDLTSKLTGSTIGGFITESGMTGTTFVITKDDYDSASLYDLSNYIDLAENTSPEILNFGDEYYFYGNLVTDIEATIYEMRYAVNLGQTQFQNSSNPTWLSGNTSYISEIGLYDNNKDLIIISKLQSPQTRQGIQQFLIKYDF